VSEESGVEVDFEVGNILVRDSPALQKLYKVVTDKGTFDAISLGESAKADKEIYIRNVSEILEPSGLLLITSCNWTEAELVAQFKSHFTLLEAIPTPSFTFGGVSGNMVTSVIFKKDLS